MRSLQRVRIREFGGGVVGLNRRRLDYDAFGEALYSIDKRDDVTVTVWQGPYIPFQCLYDGQY